MKILFVGPTLSGEIADGRLRGAPEIECRGPARQGDIAAAALQGATAIGLIDGRYEDVAAPWHKEILFALSRRIRVLGGASLGALRAAECAAFGMEGVGDIFARYASGELVDDSDVAQLHGPAELDYIPLTEALVNVEATFAFLRAGGHLDAATSEKLSGAARAIFFKNLTFDRALEEARLAPAEVDRLRPLIAAHRIDLKRRDAHLLVARMKAIAPHEQAPAPAWTMAEPQVWRRFIARARAQATLPTNAAGERQAQGPASQNAPSPSSPL